MCPILRLKLVDGMNEDTKALLKSSFGNAISIAGYVSTAATFLPLMAFLHPYLRPFGYCLVIVGVFSGARSVIAAKAEQMAAITSAKDVEIHSLGVQKDAEIAALNQGIADARRRPYTEELKRITQQALFKEMTLEGRHSVRYLMIHEPVEVGRIFIPEIPQNRQHEQLAIAMERGIVQHHVESHGLRRTSWIINPRFRPVLEDVLYEQE